MRIAQVCPYSLTVPGGVQSQVLGLARALRDLGHDARVLGPCDGPPPEPGVVPLGDSIPLSTNGSVAPIAPDVPCVLRTIRALRDERFDIVHAHEPLVPGPALTSMLVADAPVVATYHRAGVSKAYTFLGPLARLGARRAAIRCAVSEDARRTAQTAIGGTYEVVFNGIEADRFAKASPTPADHPTVFFLGRHESRKGLSVLLEAFSTLGPDVRLWVAGTGPHTEELRSKVVGDHRIEWLGRLSDADAASRLAGATVFCAPSLGGESFGVVLLEAMAAGTPIVASDLPGYRAVVGGGGEHGVLVPPDDPRALADALKRVLTEPTLARRLTEGSSERAGQYSMDALARRYLELYDKVL